MPPSRPQLDLEVRMELLDRFLRDFDEDRRDGKTVRALHATLEKHIDADDRRFDDLQKRLGRTEGRVEEHTEHLATPQPMIVPQLLQPPRKSLPPWLQKVISKPLTMLLIALATVAVHTMIRCAGLPASAAPAVPATASSK